VAAKKPDDKPKLSMEELAAQYGYAAAFFSSDPELRGLIEQAVSGQWTPDKFRAALMASNWYRSKGEATRQFIELQNRDPVESNQRIADRARQIQQKANQQGISLDPTRLANMARDSLLYGWDDLQLQQAVAAEWQYKPGDTAGGAASLEVRYNALAADYGVTLSQQQLGDFIGGTMAGRYTEDNVADFMRDTARSKYPGLQQYLDVGMTVKQVAAPYLQAYATILEVAPDTVSVTDPYVQRALQGQQPVKSKLPPKPGTGGEYTAQGFVTGGPGGGVTPPQAMPVQPMSLYDFERGLRQDPRWLQTKNAKTDMQNTAIGVLKDFGIYG
jgi:hypothetical protein